MEIDIFFKKFSYIRCVSAIIYFSGWNFEKRSMQVRMYCSFPRSFVTGPQKSSCISSFGSLSKANGVGLFLGAMAFRFLPICVQALQV